MPTHMKKLKKITNQMIFDQFAQIDQRFEQLELMIKVGFDEVDMRFIELDIKFDQKIRLAVAPLATKDFVDRRIGELRGEFVGRKKV